MSIPSSPVSKDDRSRIERFIEAYLKSRWFGRVQAVLSEPEAYFSRKIPGQEFWVAPREMIAGPTDADGLATWKPIDSPIDEQMVSGFERCLEAPLPPLFKAYLTQKCLLWMDLYEGTLPDIDPRKPFAWLEWSVRSSREWADGIEPAFVPFTDGPDRASLLCFDTSRPDSRSDYPIIQIKPAREGRQIDTAEDADGLVFQSFAAYLDFLEDWFTFSSIKSSGLFPDWLRRHGKAEPPTCYYQ